MTAVYTAQTQGAIDDFRISHPHDVLTMLRQIVQAGVGVALSTDDGTSFVSTLWAVDAERSRISFSADPNDLGTQSLLQHEEITAVAYLDSIKLQFDIQSAVLVRGAEGCVIACPIPTQMFRFQRRNAFRVRPLLSNVPLARLRHPAIADMELTLRVMDVSIGGCALLVPDDVPPIEPGSVINRTQIELDSDTRFAVNLRLQHVTSIHQDGIGRRLGCEFQNPPGEALRLLQRFIDQTQKRRRMMALS